MRQKTFFQWQTKPYCNAHYRKWQEDSHSDTRGVKRAAKADVKAAKAELKSEGRKAIKLQSIKSVIKQAQAIGVAKERKRAASAIAVSDDDDEQGFDWDRLNRGKGAPACVKAARSHRYKASNATSLEELLMDSDDSD